MTVATSRIELGVRELKNRLSHYLGRVESGDEVIVTVRGRAVARLTPIDRSDQRLDALVADGIVSRPADRGRRRPTDRIRPRGPVSDLVADQRR